MTTQNPDALLCDWTMEMVHGPNLSRMHSDISSVQHCTSSTTHPVLETTILAPDVSDWHTSPTNACIASRACTAGALFRSTTWWCKSLNFRSTNG